MKHPFFILSFLLGVLGAALFWLKDVERGAAEEKDSLLVYCAAGFRKPMTKIAQRYEVEFGVTVRLQFGGSGALASQLELAGGDLFLPADQSYLEELQKDKQLVKSFPVTRLEAGIVVPRGNPKGVKSLRDLGQEGLKLSIGDRSASIGKHTWEVFEETELIGEIQQNVVVTKPTVNSLVEDVGTGAVDAAIAWNVVADNYPEVEWLAVSEFSERAKRAEIGLLLSTKKPRSTLHFAQYVAGKNQGREIFAQMGFPSPQ